MLKQTFTFLFILLFIPVFVYGQDIVVQNKKIADDSRLSETKISEITYQGNRGGGVSIGVETAYDYFSNSVIRDQIVYAFDMETAHFFNMRLPLGGAPADRRVVHSFHDGSAWVNQLVVDAASGWPHIDISRSGSAEGTVGMVFHSPSRLAIWAGGTDYLVSQFSDGIDPSLQFIGDNIYLANSGNINRDQFQFFVTNDFGVSFTNFDSITAYHPSPIYWTDNGGVEPGMSKSPNENYFGYFGTNVGNGHVYDGVPENEADNVWMVYSNDGGSNWSAGSFGFDGVINSVSGYHTPNYAPLFENFGQVDAAVGNDAVWHVIANGYGLVFDDPVGTTAIANSFPVLYWNSAGRGNGWTAISDEAIDTIASLADLRPGNGIGQSYPGIAVSEDGQCVYAVWTGPQINALGEVDTSNGFFMTDLYHAWSTDGGSTWEYGGVLVGDPAISETFGHPAQHLRVEDGFYVADIVYMDDLSAGVNVFGEGLATLNPIMYLAHPVKPTSVGGTGNNLVNTFELNQNYPNPFNPSTKITYTLAEKSDVTLKVYDVLGKEVANLVNTTKEAGSHQVTFDASDLASGLYIYTIQAGSFTSSKKMMLLK